MKRRSVGPAEEARVPHPRKGRGRAMEPAVQRDMERRFGTSLEGVRVHDDAESGKAALGVGARAYTVGSDISFGPGQYRPGTREGGRLLAHEITHVIQQGAAPSGAGEAGWRVRPRAQATGLAQRGLLDVALEGARQSVAPDPRDIATLPVTVVFNDVVLSNVLMATHISVPWSWYGTVLDYATQNPLDGIVLIPALGRLARFYRGGWILGTQQAAGAMTLNQTIFVRGPLSLDTFVHELVHVFQYGAVGITAFLISYFGLSAATIAYRWSRGQALNPMRSSPHESQAYDLEARFHAWHLATRGTDSAGISV